MTESDYRRILVLLFGGVLAALSGCGKSSEPVDEGELNLRRIMQAYHMAMEPRGRPPADAQQLASFFEQIGETRSAEQVLRSPRDGLPYVIVFGALFDATDRQTILAYEQKGKDGNRFVLTASRDITKMTDQEFSTARFARDHKPRLPK